MATIQPNYPDLLASKASNDDTLSPRSVTGLMRSDVIDLSQDDDDEDALLETLLEDLSVEEGHYCSKGAHSPSVSTHPTKSDGSSSNGIGEFQQLEELNQSDEGTNKSDASVSTMASSDSIGSSDTAKTSDLLDRAHDRLHLQELHDEIVELQQVIERKNGELEVLSGQLRRAVATKCDLVLAHTGTFMFPIIAALYYE
jgi:hypothetical protein